MTSLGRVLLPASSQILCIRKYNDADLPKVCSLYERTGKLFPFPKLDLCPIKYVMELDGEIIAFGLAKAISEAILMVDPTVSNKVRAKSMLELLNIGVFEVSRLGFDEMHAFLTGSNQESFHRILNRLGFKDVTGIPMVLNL